MNREIRTCVSYLIFWAGIECSRNGLPGPPQARTYLIYQRLLGMVTFIVMTRKPLIYLIYQRISHLSDFITIPGPDQKASDLSDLSAISGVCHIYHDLWTGPRNLRFIWFIGENRIYRDLWAGLEKLRYIWFINEYRDSQELSQLMGRAQKPLIYLIYRGSWVLVVLASKRNK